MTKKSIYTLFSDPADYVNARKEKAKKQMIIYRVIFILLNLLITFAAASIAILTALILSMLVAGGNKPMWFFFVASGVTASTAMLTSFINFFVIKGKYQEANEVYKKIIGQITLYINNAGLYTKDNKDREMLLYTRVAQICGNYDALIEITDEVRQMESEVKELEKNSKKGDK